MIRLIATAAAAAAMTFSLAACAATANDQPQREAKACAQMGIAPATPEFNTCVTNLDAAILAQTILLPH